MNQVLRAEPPALNIAALLGLGIGVDWAIGCGNRAQVARATTLVLRAVETRHMGPLGLRNAEGSGRESLEETVCYRWQPPVTPPTQTLPEPLDKHPESATADEKDAT